MQKEPDAYFKLDPWCIIEEGYDPSRNRVSESVFTLANEAMGVRGFIDEGVAVSSLRGHYFNGVYEVDTDPAAPGYKGIVQKTHFMVNAVDWLHTRIFIDDEPLDLAKERIIAFERTLDMRDGVLTRRVDIARGDKRLKIEFCRLLDMQKTEHAYQTIRVEADATTKLGVRVGLDTATSHGGKTGFWTLLEKRLENVGAAAKTQTRTTGQVVVSAYRLSTSHPPAKAFDDGERFGHEFTCTLDENTSFFLEKRITNTVYKDVAPLDALERALATTERQATYANAKTCALAYWNDFWRRCDIVIDGDVLNQQGIRFCLFQLRQTYQGADPTHNIGAKGLSGEAYSGHTFWDTETYCFPFYLFTDAAAAKRLLLYRRSTLDAAKRRARELDCEGACYPVATLTGEEGCTLWQHASLQFQPSTGVAYAIRHYVRITGDTDFLIDEGFDMLLEISRFLASRGQWNANRTRFGFYAVMGPDEFQMMVHHNAYTNYMAKRTFDFIIETYERHRERLQRFGNLDADIERFKKLSKAMYIPRRNALIEQHEGYFDLPHLDISSIPKEAFPLYNTWSYDRIYRNDMIKQPDVLMFMFLHSDDFTLEEKRENYEFYEPRTIHESSLSPSIHSILASELGKETDALRYFGFATRMDLDDYNRNTNEGLHTTSLAAAWMNIVYGFGGFRSDGDAIRLSPTLPAAWTRYMFSLTLRKTILKVTVERDRVLIDVEGPPVPCDVYGKKRILKGHHVFVMETTHVDA